MHTYGNNAIVAEYDYYTLDQAQRILKNRERKRKKENRDAWIVAFIMVAIPFVLFFLWLTFGYAI